MVITIDQFEEVITRCPDPAQRPLFFARLHALASADSEQPQALHRVLITVRSDYEAQIDAGPLRPLWLQGRCTVPPSARLPRLSRSASPRCDARSAAASGVRGIMNASISRSR